MNQLRRKQPDPDAEVWVSDERDDDPDKDDTPSIWEETVAVLAAQMAQRHRLPN
ncbi:MAG: hypothetical protein HYT31_02985 [Parcubacteria group bacterium]|nr:hypothetical protein [Parcubacteria group bacterium]